MSDPQADTNRQFAVDVVKKLHAAGFQGIWAGGCVRDQLLGRTPTDYDVATNATPQQVRSLFGHRNTLPIGVSFGVIAVLSPDRKGNVEVATFRRDGGYSDGRHPDQVSFSDDREDAQRRDFTINGLFYNPISDTVIDYVDGQQDLEQRIVRAIGDPELRISEDRLRMLRAVRFAATFEFELDEKTRQAVARHAESIDQVSAERIAAEMRRMLTHEHRAIALSMLRTTGLLSQILPESRQTPLNENSSPSNWHRCEALLQQLNAPSFSTALAALLMQFNLSTEEIKRVCKRWKLSNDEADETSWILKHESFIKNAIHEPWPKIQRLLIHQHISSAMTFIRADVELQSVSPCGDASSRETTRASYEFCRERLAWPSEQLNPEPLINGDLLREHGMKPGPLFRPLLDEIRDAQLEGQIANFAEALSLAQEIWNRK